MLTHVRISHMIVRASAEPSSQFSARKSFFKINDTLFYLYTNKTLKMTMYDTLLMKYFGVSQFINMCCSSYLCVCVLSCTSSVLLSSVVLLVSEHLSLSFFLPPSSPFVCSYSLLKRTSLSLLLPRRNLFLIH
jgi:hypothetical protein